MIKQFVLRLIDLYQHTLSPDTGWFRHRYPGGYCRFAPHCSEFAKEAIRKKGLGRGSIMAIWRILRCNPWSKGGIDTIS